MAGASASLLRHLERLAASHTLGQLTDHQLLERFAAQRDEAAFALLVRRHGPMVLGVCRRVLGHEHDAEDAFQAAFLILARKAGSIRQRDMGGFLYRVSYHLALRARANAAKRKQRDKRGGAMSSTGPLTDTAWQDVRAVVDEELQCLPDAPRSAVVLCYLEGKTHEEAARLLGWSKGTLRRRLSQGRELLRVRLLARGLARMVALTASLFAEGSAPATVSAALAGATVRTVSNAAPIAPAVAALVEAGCAILFVSKTKMATMILLAASLLGGAGLWACLGLAAPPPAAPAHLAAATASDKPATDPPKRQEAKTMEVHGRVLDPEGKPKAGAKLLWLPEDEKISQLGVSAADGRFTIAVPKKTTKKYRVDYLIAQCDGDGIDSLYFGNLKPGKPVELRLVKDHVIRGRVVNTEGKPVAGVRVAVKYVNVYANNSLDSFLIAWMKRRQNTIPDGVKEFWNKESALLAATTDADGRFALHGVGAERLVSLRLHGAGIADDELCIVNRDGFDPKPYNKASRDNIPFLGSFPNRIVLSSPDVSVVAEAEKIIRGVVKDADSGKGLGSVTVWLPSSDDRLAPVLLQAKSDAEGRYELRGVRKSKSYLLQVMKDPDTGYMGSQVRADNATGYQPISANITLKKGVIVTGKVIDRATGQSVPGFAKTEVLHGNPFAKNYPKDNYPIRMAMDDADTGEDGTFRDVTIPGPVLLMGDADLRRLPGGEAEWRGYKQPVPDPKYPKYFEAGRDGATYYFGLDGTPAGVGGNFCKVLDIKPGTAVVHQDIFLERESVRTVKIQDAEGQPLTRVWATGLRPEGWPAPVRIKGDCCPAYAVEAGKPRLMVFYERGRKLAGSLRLTADKKEPIVVKLGPAGTIRGRLLDADGKPLAGVVVDVHYRDREAVEVHKIVHEAKQAVTDASGAFAFDEVIPELKFELTFRRGKHHFERTPKLADPTVEVKVGESRDLGAITLKQAPEKAEE